jgi:hypothetical protein
MGLDVRNFTHQTYKHFDSNGKYIKLAGHQLGRWEHHLHECGNRNSNSTALPIKIIHRRDINIEECEDESVSISRNSLI